MKSFKFEQKIEMVNSLGTCYSCLKEILQLFMEMREYILALNIYKMLAEVSLLARDYRRAIKYYIQIVNFVSITRIGSYWQHVLKA